MNEWTPEIGEILKILLEPENVKDRFAKDSGKRRSNSWTSKQMKSRLF